MHLASWITRCFGLHLSAQVIEPLLLDIPEIIDAGRLWLRMPRSGDGSMVNATVMTSLEDMKPWWKWAWNAPTIQDTERFVRREQAQFLTRQKLPYLLIEKLHGSHVGSISLNHIDWSVSSCEIAYFLNSTFAGKGYMTEAVNALTKLAFDKLSFRRIEIRMDIRNHKSRNVAERCGYQLEATLQNHALDVYDQPCHMHVYAKTGLLAP
jgi:RimJ/RimL family protein N-acetyltransferase